MRSPFPILFLAGLCLLPAVPRAADGTGPGLSPGQWKDAYTRLEVAFVLQTARLNDLQREIGKNQQVTQDLNSQVESIRSSKGPGVFDQVRLNHLLNELKDRLEKNALLKRQWTDAQKDHEQKGLSLISLLNDRIGGLIESPGTPSAPVSATLTDLSYLALKRRQVQDTLDRYQPKRETSKPVPISAFRDLETDDPESLEMTLDLLREKQKTLEDEDQKLALEIDGIQDEMKLQKKMKDFLAGIKRMNQDSGAPPEGLERSNLSRLYGGKNVDKLADHLQDLQKTLGRNRSSGDQVKQLIEQIQQRQNSVKGRGPR